MHCIYQADHRRTFVDGRNSVYEPPSVLQDCGFACQNQTHRALGVADIEWFVIAVEN